MYHLLLEMSATHFAVGVAREAAGDSPSGSKKMPRSWTHVDGLMRSLPTRTAVLSS